MINILLLTRGSGGDFYPFVRLGQALRGQGHTVTLLSHGAYEQRARQAGLAFVALDQPEEIEQLVNQHLPEGPRDFVVHLARGLPLIAGAYQQLRSLHQPGRTVLVAHHNSHILGQIAAEALEMPLVSVFTAPTFILNMEFYEEAYHILSREINQIRATLGLPAVINWRAWWRSTDNNLALWPEWFAPEQPGWPKGLVPIGFLLDEQDRAGALPPAAAAMLWDRPMLITHGTSISARREFFEFSVAACRELGYRTILVTPHTQQLPQPLPEFVTHFPALPFASVLPQARGIIHHGGIGTAAQALASATPQLILALGWDRPDNGRRIQQLGAGEYLLAPSWRPELIAAALRRIVEGEQVRAQCQLLAERLSAGAALERACSLIAQSVARPTGALAGLAATLEPRADPAAEEPGASGALARLSPEQRALLTLKLRQKRRHP